MEGRDELVHRFMTARRCNPTFLMFRFWKSMCDGLKTFFEVQFARRAYLFLFLIR